MKKEEYWKNPFNFEIFIEKENKENTKCNEKKFYKS